MDSFNDHLHQSKGFIYCFSSKLPQCVYKKSSCQFHNTCTSLFLPYAEAQECLLRATSRAPHIITFVSALLSTDCKYQSWNVDERVVPNFIFPVSSCLQQKAETSLHQLVNSVRSIPVGRTHFDHLLLQCLILHHKNNHTLFDSQKLPVAQILLGSCNSHLH